MAETVRFLFPRVQPGLERELSTDCRMEVAERTLKTRRFPTSSSNRVPIAFLVITSVRDRQLSAGFCRLNAILVSVGRRAPPPVPHSCPRLPHPTHAIYLSNQSDLEYPGLIVLRFSSSFCATVNQPERAWRPLLEATSSIRRNRAIYRSWHRLQMIGKSKTGPRHYT
jgi:hypothetical protein